VLRSRLNRSGGDVPDSSQFHLHEWLVPPVLLPIPLAALIAAALVIQA
jgi:NADH:ubiquinone oxidoreductase subunit 5 (subunit L)/multisubunit Na+/H+ antiporter MnhA subunit